MSDDVSSRADLVEVVWDLRDRAYDNPDPWDRVDAQSFFQAFAEALDAEDRRTGRLTAQVGASSALCFEQRTDRSDGLRRAGVTCCDCDVEQRTHLPR
jgi:hypothetical protein